MPRGDMGASPPATERSGEMSYSMLIEMAPGDFRAVSDSGTADTARTLIHFAKFKLKP